MAPHPGCFIPPQAITAWLTVHKVPVQHLPGLGNHFGVSLSGLVALYLAQEVPDELAELLDQAARPPVTAREIKLIEIARLVFGEDADDASEARLIDDLRGV